jgi:hypothetical protein
MVTPDLLTVFDCVDDCPGKSAELKEKQHLAMNHATKNWTKTR